MHWDTHPFLGSMVHEPGDVGNIYLTLMLQTRLEYDYGQATASEQPAAPSQEVQEVQEAPRTEGQEACRSMGSLVFVPFFLRRP